MENNITILKTETFFHSENPFPIINFHSTTKLVHHFPTFPSYRSFSKTNSNTPNQPERKKYSSKHDSIKLSETFYFDISDISDFDLDNSERL